MTQQIRLIVGLGNPGPEYENTRHNAGAIFVSRLLQTYNQSLRIEKKFHGLYGKISLDNQDVHILIPTTYMNRSGQAVQALCNFYKIEPEQMLVAHDELDLPPGSLRIKLGGGHGGNNGLRDIIEKLGGNRNFVRLRLGIGHPGRAEQVTGHVLGKLDKQDAAHLDQIIEAALQYLPEMIRGDWTLVMNRLHTK
jgi:PTH1 family peptidyl-tRNA hydrolase